MNATDLNALRQVISSFNDIDDKEALSIQSSLYELYENEVNVYISKQAAGPVTDKLKEVLKKFYPGNTPQEEDWPVLNNEPPQQPQQQQPQPQQNETMSPGGVVLPPSSPQPYRGLREQVDYEDSEEKLNQLSQPYNTFQSYVDNVNARKHGYAPQYVDTLNRLWSQFKELVKKYLQDPNRQLQEQLKTYPTQPQKYPKEQEEYTSSLKPFKNILLDF